VAGGQGRALVLGILFDGPASLFLQSNDGSFHRLAGQDRAVVNLNPGPMENAKTWSGWLTRNNL